MAEDISKITVKIGGMNYQLLAAENEEYMRQIASHADEMIRRVMQNNPQLNLNMSTVLALVNAVDEQHRAYKKQNQAQKQMEAAERQSADIKAELMRCREQTWEIKKELLHYQTLCHEYEELLDEKTSEAELIMEEGQTPDTELALEEEQFPDTELTTEGRQTPDTGMFSAAEQKADMEQSDQPIDIYTKEEMIEEEIPQLHHFQQTKLDDYIDQG